MLIEGLGALPLASRPQAAACAWGPHISSKLKKMYTDMNSPEGHSKLLSDWRKVWVVTNDDRNLTGQFAGFQSYEQIIQTMVQFADQYCNSFDFAVIKYAPIHLVALGELCNSML